MPCESLQLSYQRRCARDHGWIGCVGSQTNSLSILTKLRYYSYNHPLLPSQAVLDHRNTLWSFWLIWSILDPMVGGRGCLDPSLVDEATHDQQSAFEVSSQFFKFATCGYGQTIRFWILPLGSENDTGVNSGAVPFSTQARSCEKRSVGFPPGPPTQCPRPGTGK